LESVDGDFVIDRCSRLPNLAGLKSLQKVGGSFSLQYLASLTTTTGVENLAYVGSLRVSDNPRLQGFDGFSSLTAIGGTMFIISCDSLLSTAGLNKVEKVGGAMQIAFNPKLDNLGLTSLASVTLKIEISLNPVLSSLVSLSSLQELHGPLVVVSNNITVSQFQPLIGLDAKGSIIGEEQWSCAQIRAIGLPAPSGDQPIVDCKA